MEATVILLDCPECGAETKGTLYAWCDCGWCDYEASDAADRHEHDMTWGAI